MSSENVGQRSRVAETTASVSDVDYVALCSHCGRVKHCRSVHSTYRVKRGRYWRWQWRALCGPCAAVFLWLCDHHPDVVLLGDSHKLADETARAS